MIVENIGQQEDTVKQLTDEDLLKIYNGMVEEYGPDLPDPDVFPKCFHYLLKLYMKYHYEHPQAD